MIGGSGRRVSAPASAAAGASRPASTRRRGRWRGRPAPRHGGGRRPLALCLTAHGERRMLRGAEALQRERLGACYERGASSERPAGTDRDEVRRRSGAAGSGVIAPASCPRAVAVYAGPAAGGDRAPPHAVECARADRCHTHLALAAPPVAVCRDAGALRRALA